MRFSNITGLVSGRGKDLNAYGFVIEITVHIFINILYTDKVKIQYKSISQIYPWKKYFRFKKQTLSKHVYCQIFDQNKV